MKKPISTIRTTEILYRIKKLRKAKRRLNLPDIEPLIKKIGVKTYINHQNNSEFYAWTEQDYERLKVELKNEDLI